MTIEDVDFAAAERLASINTRCLVATWRHSPTALFFLYDQMFECGPFTATIVFIPDIELRAAVRRWVFGRRVTALRGSVGRAARLGGVQPSFEGEPTHDHETTIARLRALIATARIACEAHGDEWFFLDDLPHVYAAISDLVGAP